MQRLWRPLLLPKVIELNEGSQRDFVNNGSLYSAYIGGLGSGKTFAGICRGLKFSQQPRPPGTKVGPRGVCAAISYPVLMDVVLPEFEKITEGTGLVVDFKRAEKKAILKNGAEILFRSLDDPNKIRGLELSWFFIDEGRHVSRRSWDIFIGRLRQKEYAHGGWVCSTPNGYDWMWSLFSEDSPSHNLAAIWFGASTYENAAHLPETYINALDADYEGKWHDQEVLGKFVGLMSGAVFPHWRNTVHMQSVPYDPSLPLYSFWDFGISDLGVCLFTQIDHRPKTLPNGATEFVPWLKFIGAIEHTDWGAAEWAEAWHDWLQVNVDGRKPNSSWGDPAGMQRALGSGTSVIDALGVHGVKISPAPKKPPDYAILILDNMMAGDRVVVDSENCSRLAAAFATHHWPTDEEGNRTGSTPVHDWTSHYVDAARYGATALLSHFPRRHDRPPQQPPGPGTLGYVLKQLTAPKPEGWLGPRPEPELHISIPAIRPR